MPQYPVNQTYLVAEDDGSLNLLVNLGDGPVTVTGGYGGWDEVSRPGRRALTVWRGRDALRLTVPLLIDKFSEGTHGHSVEAECRTLERMAGLDEGDPQPPLLIVEGILPHDYSRAPQNRWVIDGLEWGDAIRRLSDGHRVRQEATLALMEHTGAEALRRLKGMDKPSYRMVKVKKGDTFNAIAKRELKAAKLGTRLARLNGARSPDVKLTRDTVKVPTGAALVAFKKG